MPATFAPTRARCVAGVETDRALVYQTSMIQKLSTTAGWLTLAFIAYATLSPIDDRPAIAGPPFEPFAGFALVGGALGLAYPKGLPWGVAIVVGSALGLE